MITIRFQHQRTVCTFFVKEIVILFSYNFIVLFFSLLHIWVVLECWLMYTMLWLLFNIRRWFITFHAAHISIRNYIWAQQLSTFDWLEQLCFVIHTWVTMIVFENKIHTTVTKVPNYAIIQNSLRKFILANCMWFIPWYNYKCLKGLRDLYKNGFECNLIMLNYASYSSIP